MTLYTRYDDVIVFIPHCKYDDVIVFVIIFGSALQYAALWYTCGSAKIFDDVFFNGCKVLQRDAACCSVLWCVAVCCSVLQ